jgi:hypothetical protein
VVVSAPVAPYTTALLVDAARTCGKVPLVSAIASPILFPELFSLFVRSMEETLLTRDVRLESLTLQ